MGGIHSVELGPQTSEMYRISGKILVATPRSPRGRRFVDLRNRILEKTADLRSPARVVRAVPARQQPSQRPQHPGTRAPEGDVEAQSASAIPDRRHHPPIPREDHALEFPSATRNFAKNPLGRVACALPLRRNAQPSMVTRFGRSERRYSNWYPMLLGTASRPSRSRSIVAPAFCVTSSSIGRSKSSAP